MWMDILAPSWPKLDPSWFQDRKQTEPNEQRSGRDEQRDEYCDFNLPLGAQKVALLDAKWCGAILINVFLGGQLCFTAP